MEVEQIDAEMAFKDVLEKIINSKFDMSIDWSKEFKERLYYYDGQRFCDY